MNVVSKQDQFYASSGAITNLKQEIGPFISLIVSTVLSNDWFSQNFWEFLSLKTVLNLDIPGLR